MRFILALFEPRRSTNDGFLGDDLDLKEEKWLIVTVGGFSFRCGDTGIREARNVRALGEFSVDFVPTFELEVEVLASEERELRVSKIKH